MPLAFISVPHSCVRGEFLYRLRKGLSYQRRAAFPTLPAKTSRGAGPDTAGKKAGSGAEITGSAKPKALKTGLLEVSGARRSAWFKKKDGL